MGPSREEQEAFPPFVVTVEDKQRWELAVRAALVIYGFAPGDPVLRGDDAALVRQSAKTLWFGSLDTGVGFVSAKERELMRAMGAL